MLCHETRQKSTTMTVMKIEGVSSSSNRQDHKQSRPSGRKSCRDHGHFGLVIFVLSWRAIRDCKVVVLMGCANNRVSDDNNNGSFATTFVGDVIAPSRRRSLSHGLGLVLENTHLITLTFS